MDTATNHPETLPWPYANAAALAYAEEHKLTPEPWPSLRKQIADLPEPPAFALHAVRVFQAFWPQYADACRAVLAKAVAAPLAVTDDESMLHVYCGFLLAEHRDSQCFDIAQQLVQLSEDACEALIGYEWPDTMEGWLASFCAEHESRREWLIEQAFDVRLSNTMRLCVMTALMRFVSGGILPASKMRALIFALIDTVVARLPSGVNHPAPHDDYMADSTFIGLLICLFDDFERDDDDASLARIKLLFDAGHVDTEVLDWTELEAHGLHSYRAPPALLGCTVVEFGWWACFNPSERQKDWIDDEGGDADADEALLAQVRALRRHPGYIDAFEADHPFVRDTPKVGRNEPCPCGSGKKFKKCCGA